MKQFLSSAFFALSIVVMAFTNEAAAEGPTNQCPPLFDNVIINVSPECLNDNIAIEVDSESAESTGWQYAFDSNNDGVNGNNIGGRYELTGIAVLETRHELYIVLNGNLPLDGHPDNAGNNGVITWGDLFINTTGDDFATTHANSAFYAVRFAELNQSGANELGLYKNVSAKSITSSNRGFSSFGQWVNKVLSLDGTPTMGSLGAAQTQSYYASNISLNAIKEGDKIGEITFVDDMTLGELDYDFTLFGGPDTVAFRFDKELILQYPDSDGDGTPDCEDECPTQPNAVKDICGICDGDGTSCLDCAGTPFGSAVVDQCGVCEGDGTSCLDCAGVPNGSAVVDQCGVCEGDGTSCLDCAGVPNGSAVVDQCGVCDGDGTSCLDCAGVPNGSAVIDQCGVCDGDGTSCLDCAGVPNGSSVIDQCGVCDGDGTSCLDCAGTPNGTSTVDQCGVCGGDGTSCLDCAGIANGSAVIDQCGVCDGDGLSCVQCVEENVSAEQTLMDSNAKKMSDVGKRGLRLALRNLNIARGGTRAPRVRQWANSTRNLMDDLAIDAWIKAWSFTSEIRTCDGLAQSVCVTVSHAPILDGYRESLDALNDTVGQVLNRNRRATVRALRTRGVEPRRARQRANRVFNRLSAELNELYTEALDTSNAIPTETTTCE